MWLFRIAGIDVYVHWLWFAAAVYQVERRTGYSSLGWAAAEYLSMFLIVLLHEFGHALACRSVGGKADSIVLWLLGGVAYVDPPQRAGAMLWSLAAGPLVNVVLAPFLVTPWVLSDAWGWGETMPDLSRLVEHVCIINFVLLGFNMLPVYPLDGGQILRSLLWFPLGRARSLVIATIIGFVGMAGFVVLAVVARSPWFALMCVFLFVNCRRGLRQGLALLRMAKVPRREGLACPSCKSAPPTGAFWRCGQCRKPFDTFATAAVCPNCSATYAETGCPHCGVMSPRDAWLSPSVPPVAGQGHT
jgi:Zn-dependent protease